MRPFLPSLTLVAVLLPAAFSPAARAAQPPAPGGFNFESAVQEIKATVEPAAAAPGQTVTWKLTLVLSPGWHTYATVQTDPIAQSAATKIEFLEAPAGLIRVGTLGEQAEAKPVRDGINELEGTITWTQPFVVSPEAKPGTRKVKATLQVQVCQGKKCLANRTLPFEAPLTVTDDKPVLVEDKYKDAVKAAGVKTAVEPPTGPNGPDKPPPATTPAKEKPIARTLIEAETTEQYRSTLEEGVLAVLLRRDAASAGLLGFLLAGVFWGAVSLITPCVFPMIPITVSYFLKQSEKEHHRPLTMATVYCGTIIVVLTVAAVLLLSFFRLLSINPVMNFGMGLLFVFFALSLLGWYEIELPAGLAQFTSAREGQGGLVGTVFMALTFTILSFACVAPFLGGFGGTAATGKFSLPERILGGLAFAITFASPFFVLALFPSLLKKMPKSGSWLNSVKVVMGFLELAAAFKFFRLGELVISARPSVFTYDLVLGVWVALALLCGLYLLGVYRLPHDSPLEHLSVPRLLFAMAFLSLGFYLLPALFKTAEGDKQRPGGALYAWVDSFLLPEPREGRGTLAWSGNLQAAIEEARAARARTGVPKYVFIDFTGKS